MYICIHNDPWHTRLKDGKSSGEGILSGGSHWAHIRHVMLISNGTDIESTNVRWDPICGNALWQFIQPFSRMPRDVSIGNVGDTPHFNGGAIQGHNWLTCWVRWNYGLMKYWHRRWWRDYYRRRRRINYRGRRRKSRDNGRWRRCRINYRGRRRRSRDNGRWSGGIRYDWLCIKRKAAHRSEFEYMYTLRSNLSCNLQCTCMGNSNSCKAVNTVVTCVSKITVSLATVLTVILRQGNINRPGRSGTYQTNAW